MILVSSCLAGLEVRYNGTHCLHSKILKLIEDKKAMTVCPELLGGLSIPRNPAEIIGGDGADVLKGNAKVIDIKGNDVTEQFIKGACATLNIAKELNAKMIILKEYSPSCGSGMIYNGEFKSKIIQGNGVTAALLKKHGIRIYSEEQLPDLLEDLNL